MGALVTVLVTAATLAWAKAPEFVPLSPEHAELVTFHERSPTEQSRAALLGAAEAARARCRSERDEGGAIGADCAVAVRLTEAALGAHDIQLAVPLEQWGDALWSRGDYSGALSVRSRALAIRESVLGADHPTVGSALSGLAEVHLELAEHEAAERLYRRALDLYRNAHGADHPSVAIATSNLARAMHVQGRLVEAEALLRRGVDVAQRTLGANHPSVATGLDNLADLLATTGAYDEADALSARALTIREFHFSSDSPEVARSLATRANLRFQLGDHAQAEEGLRRALAILEASLGSEHPEVARLLHGLAVTLQLRGAFDEAEPMFRRALEIAETAYGSEHPTVGLALASLAGLLQSLGDYERSEALYRQSLAIAEAALGPEHWEVNRTANNLALVLKRTGAFPEAERLYRRSLTTTEAALGPEHPHVATIAGNLAVLLAETGERHEAEPLYRRALAITEDALGPTHPAVGGALGNLATFLWKGGRHPEAEPLARRAVAISEAVLGSNHPDHAGSLNNLALLLGDRRAFGEAERLHRRAIAIVEGALGPEHPDLALGLNNLATLLDEQGAYDESQPLRRRALSIYESTLGPNHPDVTQTMHSMATTSEIRGDLEGALALKAEALEREEADLVDNVVETSPYRRRLRWLQLRVSTDEVVGLSFQLRTVSATRVALETLLRRKGRLADLQRDTLRRIRDGSDEQELAMLDRLQRRTGYLGVLRGRVPTASGELEGWRSERESVTREIEALQRELGGRSVEYREAARRVTWEDVAGALPRDSALCEIVVYRPRDPEGGLKPPRYGAFLLNSGGDVRAVDLGPASDIDAGVRALREAIVGRRSVVMPAAEVSSLVVEPLRRELEGLGHLYVAADGLLNLVPFDVLLQATPVADLAEVSVSYLASGRDLLSNRGTQPPRRRARDRPAWIVSDVDYERAERVGEGEGLRPEIRWRRLPGTLEEGREVIRHVHGATMLTGASATEAAIRSLEHPRLLHVASHGYFEAADDNATEGARSRPVRLRVPASSSPSSQGAEDPLQRSAIVLAGANLPPVEDDNGLLTAAEFANLDLRGTALVVLSACETGTGEIRNGDGVLGFRRAAVVAGARAQVVSLWKVDDDATTALMSWFYRHLRRGRGVADALDRAKAKVRRRPEWSHPFYWAAFTTSGDSDARLTGL